jgi:hypothetical protein
MHQEPKLSISNAHHPKHDVAIDLCPDLNEIDGLHNCKVHHHIPPTDVIVEGSIKEQENPEPKEKINPWIYPKFHQEITGRPDAYLGGCECRFVHDRPKPIQLELSLPIEHKLFHDDWRPTEWLVDGNLTTKQPTGTYKCDHCTSRRDDNTRCGTDKYHKLSHDVHHQHPDPIPINGHPVKDSPFFQMEQSSSCLPIIEKGS